MWKKRSSFIEKEFSEAAQANKCSRACSANQYDNLACALIPNEKANHNGEELARALDTLTPPPATVSIQMETTTTANIQVETTDGESKTVSKLAKADDIQPLNAEGGKTIKRRSKNKSSPFGV